MADIQSLKDKVQHEIDEIAPQLFACSDWMADNPELGLEEYQSSAKLAQMLEEVGAAVELGIAELPTAFQATLPGSGADGPTIAILAEYDALPEVGHGCGHNIIGNAAVGAGMALARLAQQGELADLPGKVVIIGTPAEETDASKGDIVDHGYFDAVDAAMMIHPTYQDRIAGRNMTAYGLEFEFFGKPAHAAADPHQGINALDAVIQTFVNIGLLRQQLRSEARVHGIVTNGGSATNVIPAYAACRIEARAFDVPYAQEVYRRVVACAEGAALATGTKLEWHEFARPYLSYIPNEALGEVFQANMAALNRPPEPPEDGYGSTDFGNVSQVVPTVYGRFSICDEAVGWHSKEVAEATRSERGHDALIAAAKAMAMSTLDLLANPDLVVRAKEEHQAAVKPKE